MTTSRRPGRGGGYALGVDLGTTYTAAALWRSGRVEIVPLGDHSPQIPSAVFRTTEGNYLVGEAALRRGGADPGRLATEFKRRVGDDTSILVGGTPLPAHALMAQLLAWVVTRVSAGQGGPPEQAVLSCPANWGPYRRQLLLQAGHMAGLEPVALCDEPSAAAVHFASTERVAVGEQMAIYDLGGGTFDAAVVRKEGPNRFILLGSPEGIEHLGGLDFDAAVLQHVWRSLGDFPADSEDDAMVTALARLGRDCKEAKEALSVDTDVTIPVTLVGLQRTVRLSRVELEELIRPSLEETVATLERAVTSASLTPADLAAVVLVGGSARIPLVTELLTRRLGRPVALSAQPKHSVALGAAMIGAGLVAGPPTPQERRRAAPAERVDTRPPPPGSARAPGPGTPATRPTVHAVLTRYGVQASTGLALLAVLAALVAPVATVPDVVAHLDPRRETAILDGGTVAPGSDLRLTLGGVELPPGRAQVMEGEEGQTANLSGAQVYTVGPLRARAVAPDGTQEPVEVRPPGGSPWPRLLSLPGAFLVLSLLFGAAYAESLLRPLLRRRSRADLRTSLGMAAVGAVLGLVLVLTTWIFGQRLLLPGSVAVLVLLCAAAGTILPFGILGQVRRTGATTASPRR